MNQGLKIGGAVCGLFYILAILFLPFLSLLGIYNVSGVDIMNLSSWIFVPLAAGLAMTVCAFILPGKTGAIVSAVCTLMPLLAFFLVRNDLTSMGLMAVSQGLSHSGLGNIGITDAAVSYVIRVGAGVIVSMILGCGSTVLCFLSEGKYKPKSQTPGLTADGGDEW